MDATEVRMRCIEAAVKVPAIHVNGSTAGIQDMAETWASWVLAGSPPAAGSPGTLHLPPKKK